MQTLYSRGLLNAPEGLLMAALIGLAFGFWLERAGFGSSRKLTALFYLRDFAVFQVMFTAVVTAAVLLYGMSAAGLVELDAIHRMETFLTPQIVGGVMLGAGFVAGGWCPGTALVGLASGKLDALVFLVSAGLGCLVYAAVYPSVGEFAISGGRGLSTLPDLLGWGDGLVLAAVVAAAVVVFALIELLRPRSV